jgi:hypothetical protein
MSGAVEQRAEKPPPDDGERFVERVSGQEQRAADFSSVTPLPQGAGRDSDSGGQVGASL